MDHIKRADRLGAITRILTATPNRLHGYAEFCELFGAAKSTISEDIDIIANSISRFAEGRVETIAGASGGVRFRPLPSKKRMRETLNGLCARLSQPGRLLPGGFVYTSDLTSESDAVWSIGEILAAEFYDAEPDVVLTMETKGIPIAMSVAQMLDVPLIIDDFMKGGGTLGGMVELMQEFQVKVVGIGVMIATAKSPVAKLNVRALMTIEELDESGNRAIVRPSPYFAAKAELQ